MKVLIGTPSFDMVHADFCFSLAAMLGRIQSDKKLRREIQVALYNPRTTMIAHARNLCVREAQRVNATHLLFLDSDQSFPPDTLERLASYHTPIVGADYVKRVPPYNLNGRPLVIAPSHSASGSVDRKALVPMMSLPFGCILINMKVFHSWAEQEMDTPWFRYIEGETDADTLSEDTGFCNSTRNLGYVILMDPQLTREVGHVGTWTFRPNIGAPQ